MTDILGRIGTILRANINDAIDRAEDPQKMIDQYIRDYTNDIAEAEQAVAVAVGNLRLAEDDLAKAKGEVDDWGSKAAAAAARATQQPADAQRFDDLAKAALKNQIAAENRVKTLTDSVATQTEFVEKLKVALNGLRAKREELVNKRDELVARQKMAEAQRQVQESFQSIDVKDPTSDIARMEEKVRREEAMARGMAEVSASSLDAQFDALETTSEDLEVDARLAALKSGTTGSTGGTGGAPTGNA
ncbi:MAG: PspA/IM30 family protein [Chloroflexota bacterium]